MTVHVFELLTGGIRDGKQYYSVPDGTIEPGDLIKIDSGGSGASLGTAANIDGFAYGGRNQTYKPTTKFFAAGELLTRVWSVGEALLSSDFFSGGSLPNPNDGLYAAANGLITSTPAGGVKVGKMKLVVPRTVPTGGTGSTQNLAHIEFSILP